jgi:phage shock protein C
MKPFDKILQGGLYRSRKGLLLGVCRGIAEYFDFSLFWTRVIAIMLLIFTGFWPVVIIYCIAALLMKPEPVVPFETDEEQEFYDSYVDSRKRAAERLRRRYENLDHRIQRLEHTVTAQEFDWDRRFRT